MNVVSDFEQPITMLLINGCWCGNLTGVLVGKGRKKSWPMRYADLLTKISGKESCRNYSESAYSLHYKKTYELSRNP